MDGLIEPALVVAAGALLLQAIKATFDLAVAILGLRASSFQRDMSTAATLVELVDSLSIEVGDKISLKKRILRAMASANRSRELNKIISDLV